MRPAQRYHFTWISGHLAIDIEIAYTPNLYIFDHLGIRSVCPFKTPLPISETGYLSHYLPAGTVAEAGGPVEAVRIILDTAAHSPEWQTYLTSQRQGCLL
ncbi:hypothetical protein SAMN02745166_03486 [Prosthecobacter debontii]|uniref:Uncharacterized protein n=1 Tax=Prosthecobacter debontii TaxID=48467 RepID=A0A1T4YJ97_9BACT|nr:hypothetical protein [Prosthecobacter debontii]SKB01859.1 hypothetical protein SAMN02745166_03486 [Prosthecobacter debontii]